MSKQREERRAQIDQWIQEQEASGLNVKEFAKQRGISPWSLYDWKRKRRLVTRRRVRQSFVEVQVAAGEVRRRGSSTTRAAWEGS